MTKRTWLVNLDDRSYRVQITHGYWSGRRKVLVDDVLVSEGWNINASGISHSFTLGEHNCDLLIATNGFVYRYILLIDNTPHLAIEDKPTDRIIQAAINEHVYWQSIAQLTGLKYVAAPKARGSWKHRLIGAINGYVLAIQFGQLRQSYKPIVATLIRYMPVANLENLKNQLVNDLVALFGKLSRTDHEITESHLWAAIPYNPKKESSEVMARKILDLVSAVSQYTRPVREDICDSRTCKRKVGVPLKVVFLNEFPLLLCEDCINEISNWGRQAKDGYKRAPAGLFKGVVAGVGVTLLGGIIWAIVAVLLNSVAAVLGGGMFVSIVKTMDRIGTKRTSLSILIAAMLAVCGVVLGVYLAILWLVLRESAISALTVASILFELKVAWELMWANPKLLNLSLAFGSFGIILYLITMWMDQNSHFSRLFRPQAEVIDYRWF